MLLPLCALKRADHHPLDGEVSQPPLVVDALITVDRLVLVDERLPLLRGLVDLLLQRPFMKAPVSGCKRPNPIAAGRRHWAREQVHVVVAHLVAVRKSNTAAVVPHHFID